MFAFILNAKKYTSDCCNFIGSDGGRGGHARVKWGHDMNDDDFEEVAVKPSHNIQHHPEVGRSQSGGARYNDNKHSNR